VDANFLLSSFFDVFEMGGFSFHVLHCIDDQLRVTLSQQHASVWFVRVVHSEERVYR